MQQIRQRLKTGADDIINVEREESQRSEKTKHIQGKYQHENANQHTDRQRRQRLCTTRDANGCLLTSPGNTRQRTRNKTRNQTRTKNC